MPNNDLARINNLLKEIASNAEIADKVFARLAQTIASTGKNVNVASIQSRIESTGTVPERMRLGGGQRLPRSASSGLVNALSEFLFPAEFEREYKRLVEQAVQKAQTRMIASSKGMGAKVGFDAETNQILSQISQRAGAYVTKSSVTKPAYTRPTGAGRNEFDAETEKLLAEISARASKIVELDNKVHNITRPVGIGRNDFDNETEKLLSEISAKAKIRADRLVYGGPNISQRPVGAGRDEFDAETNQMLEDIELRAIEEMNKRIQGNISQQAAETIKSTANNIGKSVGKSSKTTLYMDWNYRSARDRSPDALTEGTVNLSNVKEKLKELTPFITEDKQFETLWQSVERGRQVFKKLGSDLQEVKIKSKLLADGTVQMELGLIDLNGIVTTSNLLMNQQGKVIDQAASKEQRYQEALKKRKQLEESLKSPTRLDVEKSIGQGRAGAAFDYAAQFGLREEHLKKMQVDAKSNVATVSFEKMLEGNIPYKLDVTVDQYGKALAKTNTRLMNFTDSIIRNTQELFKWSIGVGVVFGAYTQLERLISVAIDNQSRLADVAVTLGDAQRSLNSIFNDAADVAEKTEESINAVLETYTMAYRAVGDITDPMKRTTAANKLLADATMLNKLSNLDAAQSIDVLSASLRQSEKFLMTNASAADQSAGVFGKGTEMLDKWVRVIRIANVDLGTLATAFSVTAESALNAGMNVEELNAVIASLSAKIGGLGGEETGNAVRAIIGGVYQEQAISALSQYGIAVQDTEGKMRNFLDISKDINEMWRMGIIDDTQLNKIAYTLGGGVRRGQQYVSFLTDLESIQKITKAQEDSTGEAEKALGVKMETVASAITKLGNSFQKLAQSLGTNGGILDSFTKLITMTSGLVDMITALSSALGRLTIPASILALIKLYTTMTGGKAGHGAAKLDDIKKSFGGAVGNVVSNALSGMPFGLGEKLNTPTGTQRTFTSGGWQNVTMTPAKTMGGKFGNFVGSYGMGIALSAMPAISRAASGQTEEAKYDLIGAGIGTGLGAFLGGPAGAMIGGQLGAFIAEKFVSETVSYEGEFSNFFKGLFVGAEEEPGAGTKTLQQETTDKILGMADNLGTTLTQHLGNFVIWMNNAVKSQDMNYMNREQAALVVLSQAKDKTQFNEALKLLAEARQETPEELTQEQTTFYQNRNQLALENKDFLQGLVASYREELLGKEIKKEISAKDYRAGMQTAMGLPSSLTQIYTALDLTKQLKGVDNAKVKFKELGDLIVNASQEDTIEVMKLVGEIQDLTTVVDELKGKSPDALSDFRGEAITAEEAAYKLAASGEQLTIMLDALKESADKVRLDNLRGIKLMDIFEGGGYNPSQMEKIMGKARQLQGKELDENLKHGVFTDRAQMEAYISAAEPLLFYMGQQFGYAIQEGIVDSKFIQEAIDELGIPKMDDLGYSFMDATSAQIQQAANGPMYDAIRNSIIAAGGTSEETAQLVIPSDDPTNPLLMTKDWAIVQHLLQEILNVEEKQLDGMYNLPSGASFYVPFQAWKMDTETRQASAEGIDTTAFNQSTGTLYDASGQLIIASTTMENMANAFIKQLQAGTLFPEDLPPEFWEWAQQNQQELPQTDRFGNPIDYSKFIQKGQPPLNIQPPPVYQPYKETYFPGKAEDELIDYSKLIPVPKETTGVLPGYGFGATPYNYEFPAQTQQDIDATVGATQIPGQPSIGEFLNNLWNTIIGNTPTVPTTEVPPVNTQLSVNFQTQTQLIVDGRALADVVKPYLYEDLVSFENSAGSSTGTAIG